MDAAIVQEMASQHAERLFSDHAQNAKRLAEANKQGEAGRKEEMMRLFGIDVDQPRQDV